MSAARGGSEGGPMLSWYTLLTQRYNITNQHTTTIHKRASVVSEKQKGKVCEGG